MSHLKKAIKLGTLVPAMLLMAANAVAQTNAFTYQGKLADGGSAANGNYDIQFKLFDTAATGTGSQQGSTITSSSTQVAGGIFTVQLDFGSAPFAGANRFLEIGVRPAGSANPYTVLSPRQQLTSTPYAIRSKSADTATNATQLGGIASSGFLQNTTAAQAGTSFNIDGNGTLGGSLAANTVSAATQYNIGGSRMLSAPGTQNTFVGVFAGFQNTSGIENSFVGYGAGSHNTTGMKNSFFGSLAGQQNTDGESNSFFGTNAGMTNTTGNGNSFFGMGAGRDSNGWNNSFFGAMAGVSNQSGGSNVFIGTGSGFNNLSGSSNTFVGYSTGTANTEGEFNSFFGTTAGNANLAGAANTFIGHDAGRSNIQGNFNVFVGESAGASSTLESNNTAIGTLTKINSGVTNGTAIGFRAQVDSSNSLVLGSTYGVNGVFNPTRVGVGTTSPLYQLHVIDPFNSGFRVQTNMSGGTLASFGGFGDFYVDAAGVPGGRLTITQSGNVGIGNNNPSSKLQVNGNVAISGSLSKGSGSFKIDHPLDPENKYLYHSFVESPDMMNIYNGVARLNRRGEAVIALPDWFEALNKDFRYQLTCMGGFAPVFVAREIKNNSFKIAGGKPGMRVSWQVTGVRHDAYANKHRITVEEEKPAGERGSYLHPDAFPNPVTGGDRASGASARSKR
ncbi:MAG TPA: hypothetical protein VNS63_00145 [Blastocatellia bacterium]|nr:hypothetical protein [Blastocatellia bacterium]